MKRRELVVCKSGRHTWVGEEDAAKCCDGWHRELRVGIGSDGVPWYAHVWVRDEEEKDHGSSV